MDPETGTSTRRTRRNVRRSKSGCPQCRQRRVKCDETRPECMRCVNRHVRCGYLDYNAEEIEKINIEQWIVSNPSSSSSYTKGSHTASSINTINLILIHHYQNEKAATEFQTVLILQLSKNTRDIRDGPLPLFTPSLFTDITIFDGITLLSYGLFLLKRPGLLSIFLQIQNTCMNHILQNINILNDTNIIATLTVSLALALSSKSLPEDIGIHQKSKFANGPISMLRTVYEDSSKFPITYPILKQYCDGLESIKSSEEL